MLMRHTFYVFAFLGTTCFLITPGGAQNSTGDQKRRDDQQAEFSSLIDQLADRYLSTRKNARKKLVEAGSAAVPELLRAAKNGSFRVRKNCLVALGKIQDERAIPLLLRIYLGDNIDLKAAARRAIKHFGAKALDPLTSYIEEHPQQASRLEKLKKRIVRLRVEKVLMHEISPEGGRGFYQGQFDELKPFETEVIPVLKKIALGKYEFLRSLPPHVEKVRDRNAFSSDPISRMAVDAIGVVGTEEQIPFLKEIIGDEPTYTGLEEAAAVALYRIGHKKPIRQLKDKLQKQFEEAKKGKRGRIIARYGDQYAMILARMDREEEAIEVYRSLLKRERSGRIPRSYKQLWWYNLACSYAQTEQQKKALNALRQSVDLGYRDVGWLEIDGDLDPLRGMDAFKTIKKKMKTQEKPRIRTRIRPMIEEAEDEIEEEEDETDDTEKDEKHEDERNSEE